VRLEYNTPLLKNTTCEIHYTENYHGFKTKAWCNKSIGKDIIGLFQYPYTIN